MRLFVFSCFVLMSAVSFGEESKSEPTLADTQSVLVEGDASSSVAPSSTTAAAEVCSDCKIRRRVFGRGYVVLKHEKSDEYLSTTREVLDPCCNKIRSRTVTKTKCDSCCCN